MTPPPQAPWSLPGLVAALAPRGARPALLSLTDGRVDALSSDALARRVWGAARALARADIGPGDVVALHGAGGPEWIACALACGWTGAVLAPIDVERGPEDAAADAAAAGAALLVSDAAAPREGLRGRPLARIAARESADPPAPAPGARNAPAALFRTSGTTGAPKLFHLSTANLGYVAEAVATCGLLRAEDRVLLPLPLHHVYPWITAVLGSLTAGATLILPSGPTGPEVAAALRATRPTVLVGVPKLYGAMLDAIAARAGRRFPPAGRALLGALDACAAFRRRTGLAPGRLLLAPLRRAVAPDLRMLVCGGARLDRRAAERLEALGWDVRSGYGLSETASLIVGNLHAKRLGTEGRALPGSEARIDAPDGEGFGEILLRGPGVFAGYLGAPEATARAFDPEGFFRSGDLGRLDAEGFLKIRGRASEALTLGGGETLDPERIEAAYAAAPEIAEIGVFERGGRLLGLAVPDRAALAGGSAADAATAARVALAGRAQRLPSPQRLAGVALTGAPLPRTRLGKLRRFLLPALYDAAASGAASRAAEAPTAEDAAWLAAAPRAAVWALLRRRYGAALGLDAHLQLDLGLDSFDLAGLLLDVERETGRPIPPERAAGVATPRDLLEACGAAAEASRAPAAETDWLAPRTRLERAVGATAHRLARAALRGLWRLSAAGAERLPNEGPLLLCPNHASDLDPAALAAALPRAILRRVRWGGVAGRLFRRRWSRAFCRCVRAFPVDETAPEHSLALAKAALARGEIVVWFPEGWRSPDGALGPFQSGIGRLIAETGVAVAPVAIHGTFEAWPRSRRLPRLRPVSVAFGAPIPAAALAAGSEGAPAALAEAARLRLGAFIRATSPGRDAA